jgi:choline dehydrogenase-like flavoprotein
MTGDSRIQPPRAGPLHGVVSALAYSLAGPQAGAPGLEAPYNDVTQFTLRQLGRMSGFLSVPMEGVTAGFEALCLFRHGRRFRDLPPEVRRRQVDAWRRGPLGFQRDFIRFYESLATLALHSRGSTQGPGSPGPAPAVSGVISHPPGELRCEVAVIGSGPGGSITAALLAEAGRDVVLLEEGPFLQLESCEAFSIAEMEQKYRNGGLTVALGAEKIAYAEGRCVGGGSEINSGLYHRTPPEVLESWRRDFGVEGLSEADLLPHFEACERDLSVSALPGAAPEASLRLREGAARLGWKSVEVPRWFKYEGASAGGTAQGSRQSMTRTFVPRFLGAGGRLVPGVRADSLRRNGNRWLLAAHRGGLGMRISAETVFVCGGAVQTPALLRRSGIGRGVGDSLRLHPTIKLVAQFPGPVNTAGMGVPVHQVKEFSPRLGFGCSVSTPPFLALALLEHPGALREVSRTWPQMATYYAMITGQGRGTVRTLPGFRDPLVRYRLTRGDRRDLADGLAKLAETLFAAGAEIIYPGLAGTGALRGPDDLAGLPAEFPAKGGGLMTIHLFSSCPMGEDRSKCVTDSFGRVHGVPGLRIADASLLCGAPGVNPQGTVMAIARRNALHFLGKL